MHQERDNLKAGLFVLTGLVLALGVVFILSDLPSLLEPRRRVKVTVPLAVGLNGLVEGAPVTLGGQPIGSVTRIDDLADTMEDGSTRVTGKLVRVSLPKHYKLYHNARIEIRAPLIGNDTRLNIRSVGDGQPYHPDQPLIAGIAPTSQVHQLVQDLGIRDTQREQVGEIIANLQALTGTLNDQVPKLLTTGQKLFDDLQTLTTDAHLAVADLKQGAANLRQWSDQISDRSLAWIDRIDQITATATRVLTDLQQMIEQYKPPLTQVVQDLQHTTGVVRQKTLTQLTQALDQAHDALESVQAATGQVHQFIAGQRPVIEGAVTNARLTSEQLKMAAVEIRRSPWRLLYRPNNDELNTDNLYDAARSFALAAGTLNTAAQSLQGLAGVDRGDDQRVREMLNHLNNLFDRFQEVEQAFWDALDEYQ